MTNHDNASRAAPSATLHPESISDLLGWFRRKIEPHLPADLPEADSDALNDLIGELFQQHVAPLDFPNISPVAAYIALKAIETASECQALDPICAAMVASGHLSNKMASMVTRSREVRTKADLLARIDWLIGDMEEFGGGYATAEASAALQQIRFDVSFLVDDAAIVDHRRVALDLGPTCGELAAVEKAFAKIGRSVEEAHDAIGYKPASRGDA